MAMGTGLAPRASFGFPFFVVIQLWHAAAVFALPYSRAGAELAWLGLPFHQYMRAFSAYDEPGKGFLLATTWLDLFEVALCLVALLIARVRAMLALSLAWIGQLLYAYKLLVVLAIELSSGLPYTQHNTQAQFWVDYLIPNAGMLLVPMAFLTWALVAFSSSFGTAPQASDSPPGRAHPLSVRDAVSEKSKRSL